MQIYLVGGAVRDKLLGVTVKERDWVVVGATPEQLLKQGYQQVGKGFPVFLHPQTREEYALARKERKTTRGYYGFECDFDPSVTLEEDLQRRDLSINAMAMDDKGRLIDPYQGQQDLQQRLLRHVSPAFMEDPVRVLRLARFKARFHHLGFQLAAETRALVYQMVENGELVHLVAERVWQELEKSLHENDPGQFILTLRQTGALGVIFPEIDALFGVPASLPYHPEIDSGIHTLQVLAYAKRMKPEDRVLAFTALMHDLGKALTPKSMWPSHACHDERGEAPIRTLCERLKVPRVYREAALLACRYHLNIHHADSITAEKVVDVLVGCGAFRQRESWHRLLDLCEADVKSAHPDKPYMQRDFWEQCLQACSQVSIESFIEQELVGKQMQIAIKKARIEAVSGVIEAR